MEVDLILAVFRMYKSNLTKRWCDESAQKRFDTCVSMFYLRLNK